MLKKEELEILLSRCLASQADFAEIFEEEGTNESISMLNGKIEDVDRAIKAGIGVRLYKGVQSVYGYTNDGTISSLENLIDDLREAVGKAEIEKKVTLNEEVYENKHKIIIDPIEANLKDKTDLMGKAYQSAKAVDSRIVKVQVSMGNVRQHVQISNSDGKLVQDTRVRTRMSVDAFAMENGVMQSGGERPGASMGLEFYTKTTPEEIGKEASRIALVMLEAKDCPSGKMPVVIDNGFGGVIFHEACGHSLEATAVAKDKSVFCHKLGEQIANSCVTAIDDGTIPNAWGSQNVDDEGNFQKKRVLIENGILKTYMIDQLNARRMHMDPTSSSRRQSYKYEPTSRMTNTYIAPGNTPFEDLFKGIKKGLYAKKMGGGSVNPVTGEFNFAVNEGYLIEDGKISYPVKGASLIGNGAEILMNIEKISDNLSRAQGMCGSRSGSIPTDVGQPALLVSSITVGGTANE